MSLHIHMHIYRPSNCCFFSLHGPLWVLSQPCRSRSCVVSCYAFMKLFYEQVKWWLYSSPEWYMPWFTLRPRTHCSHFIQYFRWSAAVAADRLTTGPYYLPPARLPVVGAIRCGTLFQVRCTTVLWLCCERQALWLLSRAVIYVDCTVHRRPLTTLMKLFMYCCFYSALLTFAGDKLWVRWRLALVCHEYKDIGTPLR